MKITPENFEPRFAELSEPEKAIVHLKALVHGSATKDQFRRCLAHADIRAEARNKFTHQKLKPVLDGLVERGFLTKTYMCKHALLHHATVDACASDRAKDYAAAVRSVLVSDAHENWRRESWRSYSYGGHPLGSPDEVLGTLRLAIYLNDAAAFQTHMEKLAHEDGAYLNTGELLQFITETPFDLPWLTTRAPAIQVFLFSNRLSYFLSSGRATIEWTACLEHYLKQQNEDGFEDLKAILIEIEFLSGDFENLERKLEAMESRGESEVVVKAMRGCIAFCRGADTEALDLFHAALKLLRKETRKRKIFLGEPAGPLFMLALLRNPDPSNLKTVEKGLDAVSRMPGGGFEPLVPAFLLARGHDEKAQLWLEGLSKNGGGAPLQRALTVLVQYFIAPEAIGDRRAAVVESFETVETTLPLLACMYADVLAADDPAPYQDYRARAGLQAIRCFSEVLKIAPRWRRGLDNLEGFFSEGPQTGPKPAKARAKRLAWLVDPETLAIQPVQQSVGKNGVWSKGRNVALKRLHRLDPALDYLTDQDRMIAKTVRKENYGWYRGDEHYYFDESKAWLALAGHPLAFHSNAPDRPLELVATSPEIEVKRGDAHYQVSLSHVATSPTVFVEAETPTRFRVVDFSKRMLRLSEILGQDGVTVPTEGKDRLFEVLERASATLPVHSDDLAVHGGGAPGDATPRLQLQPRNGGLKVNLRVRPFGAGGPDYPVGLGAISVMAAVDGVSARVLRDFERERELADELVAAVSTLRDNYDGGFEWILDDLEVCLELLAELEELPERAAVEWPEGSRLSVTRTLDGRAASLRIGSARDWFSLSGTFKVDEGRVVEMRVLLDALDQARGRFVPIGDGHFIALSNHFKAELEKLRRLGETTKDGLRFHGLGALALRDLLDDVGQVKGDKKWNAHLERIDSAQRFDPALPSTLRAELRDYQREGFTWLSRLAHWGVGACLADDMGVGKTVQALAVMLELAPDGPCLVVAPTSVCHNWVAEIDRFAPTLNPIVLNFAADRAARLEGLGPMDVVICSYGLLVQETEALNAKPWRVVVLDEAQAIKNAATRRARAAFGLDGRFRLALTGTPIENNLGELWSLFNFINPGLLGSEKSFQTRFANAAEHGAGAPARQALKALIRPFILRRMKSMVLSELPPRIEQTLRIEMDDDEAAFYEGLRRRAVETISGLDETAAGRRKIHILAEITRLRRACCHPSLIDPDLTLGGAKMGAFLKLVEELGANRHKALVFSQYVGFLDLVRAALDRKGVTYQYLDGSTPAKAREGRVAAFQSGEGDLFLISLKAGGAGLNLTAADYVIHLDPWWNPAVEDQASDRAHRIGQHRPVTIYRLIMAGTIEERITALHRDKRDLASDLLAGAEVAGRLDETDLLRLMESQD